MESPLWIFFSTKNAQNRAEFVVDLILKSARNLIGLNIGKKVSVLLQRNGQIGSQCAFGCSKRRKNVKRDLLRSDSEGSTDDESGLKRKLYILQVSVDV